MMERMGDGGDQADCCGGVQAVSLHGAKQTNQVGKGYAGKQAELHARVIRY